MYGRGFPRVHRSNLLRSLSLTRGSTCRRDEDSPRVAGLSSFDLIFPHENLFLGSGGDLSLIDGCTLLEILEGTQDEGTGGLSEAHCVALTRQAVQGLRHLHVNGRVYGAFEPANIFIESETGTVKLADGEASTPYMAPEVCFPLPRSPRTRCMFFPQSALYPATQIFVQRTDARFYSAWGASNHPCSGVCPNCV
jgi:hypothetical protein